MVTEDLNKTLVESIIGPSGSPIPRLPHDKRLQLRKWLATTESVDKILPRESYFRALLASGTPVRGELLDPAVIFRALDASDLLRYGHMLSVTIIDPSALFRALETTVRELSFPLSPKTARRLSLGVKRWTGWLASRKATLSQGGVLGLLRVLDLLLTRTSKPRGRSEKSRERTNSFVRAILSLACSSSSGPIDPEVCLAGLQLLEHAKRTAGEDVFNVLLLEGAGKRWHESIRDSLPAVIDGLVSAGSLDELNELSNLSKGFSTLEQVVQSSFRSLWETKAAVLPGYVQKWLQDYLGIGAQDRLGRIEFVDKSERPEISQLGLALLRVWDARQDSEAAKQAFEVLQGVCNKFFNLRLGGEVGSRVRSDPRFHEVLEESSGRGELIIQRPWVEWREGETWKVIIRAVVAKG